MRCSLIARETGALQIIRFPQNPGRGRVIDAQVPHLDFFPAVHDLPGRGLSRMQWTGDFFLSRILPA